MASYFSTCHTDLGRPDETISGYYPPSGGPWLWDSIQANAGGGNIAILHSVDDSIVPFDEGKYVAQKLDVEMHVASGCLTSLGHTNPSLTLSSELQRHDKPSY